MEPVFGGGDSTLEPLGRHGIALVWYGGAIDVENDGFEAVRAKH